MIRHGETAWSLSGQHTSITDLELTAVGIEQAEALAEELEEEEFALVCSSPRRRALATAALEDRRRNELDAQNAALLGYDSELAGSQNLQGTAFERSREDLISELEENRYFIVLMAYDFQVAWKDKKHKLLWVTRMSVRQRGNDFGKALPAMTRYASRYFGRNTNGLIRKPLPEGHVEIGLPKVVNDR